MRTLIASRQGGSWMKGSQPRVTAVSLVLVKVTVKVTVSPPVTVEVAVEVEGTLVIFGLGSTMATLAAAEWLWPVPTLFSCS